ncbi:MULTISPECIES: HAMP domain-containing sensor histidine kinase [unclassified Nocardioides]|uniref:sensor histidine kinase n=1 Tax=unclassified Nocardioides TaxID=2615069 RepID=UPI00114EC28D|nr:MULTISPECIES: HAMP domain-containing sensor histidine kinase [unclassified Nocardioides]TQK71275.1 signal transduction histidine kinase [Nocardioides sp. SLBN-35]WGY04558.1 HAMP domain-containing sensor histidine kinase [Nocardioides sp. QY071]
MRVTLRSRVIALAVGTATLVIVLAGIPLALMLRSDARASTDQEATYAAQGTADYLSARTADESVLEAYLTRLNRREGTSVSVRLPDGTVIGAPRDLSAIPRNAVAGSGDRDSDDLGVVSVPRIVSAGGRRFVVVDCRTSTGEAQVVALVSSERVAERTRNRYLVAGATASLLLGLAWLAAEVTGRRIVRPLRRTAETAIALGSGDLTARAPTGGPAEVARVATELNALADRIDELLTGEREAAADLSHRLRTPLTAVRLSVEGLPAGPARDELEAAVGGLERSLTHLIRAARSGVRGGVHLRCDAAAVVAERTAFWAPLTEDQGRMTQIELAAGPVWAKAGADDLAAAVDALIENVVAHTPEGTAFSVRLDETSEGVVLEIVDDGPGIAVSALDRGTAGGGSTGLGLDIARRAAESGGGRLEVVELGGRHGIRLVLRPAEAPLA